MCGRMTLSLSDSATAPSAVSFWFERDTMSYHKCWIPSDVNRYFTTESMSKDREAFLTVHLPIGRIRVDRARSRAITKDGISEQELLAIVTDSSPGQPNRIFVI